VVIVRERDGYLWGEELKIDSPLVEKHPSKLEGFGKIRDGK